MIIMKTFSKKWISSKNPKKQRKYRIRAPKHIKSGFMVSSLDKKLRDKHGKRSIRVRPGDKVVVMRGNYKGREAKVDRVDVQRQKVYLEKVETPKKAGQPAQVPFDASNLKIVELDLEDKKRKVGGQE